MPSDYYGWGVWCSGFGHPWAAPVQSVVTGAHQRQEKLSSHIMLTPNSGCYKTRCKMSSSNPKPINWIHLCEPLLPNLLVIMILILFFCKIADKRCESLFPPLVSKMKLLRWTSFCLQWQWVLANQRQRRAIFFFFTQTSVTFRLERMPGGLL